MSRSVALGRLTLVATVSLSRACVWAFSVRGHRLAKASPFRCRAPLVGERGSDFSFFSFQETGAKAPSCGTLAAGLTVKAPCLRSVKVRSTIVERIN